MRVSVLTAVIAFLVATTIVAAQDASKHPREIPVPAAASAELQAIIKDRSWPDISTFPEPPETTAEWLALIEPRSESRSARIPAILERTNVRMERDKIADVSVHHLTPAEIAPEHAERLFLYLHGGAYVFGDGDGGTGEAILIANRIGIPVLSVDYRMPPIHPFPAAVDDVTAVYRELLKSRPASSIIIGGTSAGGGLSLAAVHQFRNLDLPLPGAIYAGTPWADLTKTSDSLYANEVLDRVLLTYDGVLGAAARLYAGEHDMKNELISPVYGSLDGFPPTILITGTRDMFLSDAARTHRKLRAAGVDADLHVYEGLSHAGYALSPNTPESLNMYGELDSFIDRHLD